MGARECSKRPDTKYEKQTFTSKTFFVSRHGLLYSPFWPQVYCVAQASLKFIM